MVCRCACRWAFAFCVAWVGDSPWAWSGAAFLLVGEVALCQCPLHQFAPVLWRWLRRPGARREGSTGLRRRWRRRRRRPVRRRRPGFQRACVAGCWSSFLVLGQLLPRYLQRWRSGHCHCPWYGCFASRCGSRVAHNSSSALEHRWQCCSRQWVLLAEKECAPSTRARRYMLVPDCRMPWRSLQR